MLKTLIKKQLAEAFRGYFYDARKNKKRSKAGAVCYFSLFVLLMVGVLGGMFAGLSLSMCGPMTAVGMGWLYFLIMTGFSVILGTFGGVFNSYSGLYLGKDNDLLLSMPIPVKYIMASRLINVYIMGAMYSIVAILPAVIVYWIVAGANFSNVVCGIILMFVVTLIVMVLSCVLGWVVAKLSLRLRRKSFAVVVASLVFIGVYYLFCFKANVLIKDLIENAGIYGDKLKSGAYCLYLLGKTGEGSWTAAFFCLAVSLTILAVVWLVISKTFLSMVTSSGKTRRAEYIEKPVKQRSGFAALLGKEMSKFLSSSTYMLNSGLGVLFVTISGFVMLFKGEVLFSMADSMLEGIPGASRVLVLAALCLLVCTNNISAPSVSLEGKNIWILQSLPVEPKTVLRAKALFHLLLSGIPALFAAICTCTVMTDGAGVKVTFVCCLLAFTYFSVMFSSFWGIKLPNLTWTSEVVPVKQGAAVTLSLIGGWVIVAIFTGLFFLVGCKAGVIAYLLAGTVLFAAAALVLRRTVYTKGSRNFAEL